MKDVYPLITSVTKELAAHLEKITEELRVRRNTKVFKKIQWTSRTNGQTPKPKD
jgi:hypothetical protein